MTIQITYPHGKSLQACYDGKPRPFSSSCRERFSTAKANAAFATILGHRTLAKVDHTAGGL